MSTVLLRALENGVLENTVWDLVDFHSSFKETTDYVLACFLSLVLARIRPWTDRFAPTHRPTDRLRQTD